MQYMREIRKLNFVVVDSQQEHHAADGGDLSFSFCHQEPVLQNTQFFSAKLEFFSFSLDKLNANLSKKF